MSINETVILKLEKLAKLKLDQDEQDLLMKDINEILKMVDKLNELDTDGVKPLVYLNLDVSPLDEDESRDMLSQKDALSNAPKSRNGFFSVKKFLDG